MIRIHELLSACKPVSAPIVARELEVSAKTVARDFTFMRDQLRLPLDYIPESHSFVYTMPVASVFGGWKEAA